MTWIRCKKPYFHKFYGPDLFSRNKFREFLHADIIMENLKNNIFSSIFFAPLIYCFYFCKDL